MSTQKLSWQAIRSEVLERDMYTCQNCGNQTSSLDVHHIIPRHLKGLDSLNNLFAFCEKCHWIVTFKSKRQLSLRNGESVQQKLISISVDTHTRLRHRGILGQTFNDVIDNLMDIAENTRQYQKEVGEVR